MKDRVEPRPAAQYRRFARQHLRDRLGGRRDELRREIAAADILGQCASDELREIAGRCGCCAFQNGRPCIWPPMQSNIGTERMKLMREA